MQFTAAGTVTEFHGIPSLIHLETEAAKVYIKENPVKSFHGVYNFLLNSITVLHEYWIE